jgi:hypothetical protein
MISGAASILASSGMGLLRVSAGPRRAGRTRAAHGDAAAAVRRRTPEPPP